MIKVKNRMSDGFKSNESSIMLGNTMSILKTAKLANSNILNCISQMFDDKALFA